ncbi:hypothetical protein KGY77_08520 [Candidatus Bipolaricaulota bacterium]|nr:hypothetical protein [Candidatus Bipolaricaulota bacterium]
MNKRFTAVLLSLVILILLVFVSSSGPVEELEKHKGSIAEVVELIQQGNEDEALQVLDELHNAVVSTRAGLRGLLFTTTAQKSLTDPFILPEGTYRVHFTTENFGAVKVLSMEGKTLELLFNIGSSRGGAQEAASTVYRSDGSRIMIEFSNVSPPPGELVFEKLE